MGLRDRSFLSLVFLFVWAAAACLQSPVEAQSVAANEWTWVGGNNTVGSMDSQPGVYGALGVAAAGNIPGGRVDVGSWTDSSGNFWLFGGSTISGGQALYFNDLWRFSPSTNEWTWMAGSNAPICGSNGCGNSGSYGTLGVMDPANAPGSRESPASWTDRSGNVWLYGGLGFDSIGQVGPLNDLWEFSPSTNQWAWMGGSATVPGNGYGDPGVYGILGTPAAANNPGALFIADSWVDPSGNAWLFGGWGNDAKGFNGLPNNLWEFDGSAEQFAWLGGNSMFGESNPWIQASVYGTMGVAAAGNTPGSRWQSAGWTDSKGDLWLFGGGGYDSDANQGYLNETWEFDPSTRQWAWMGGDSTMYCPANADKQNCGRVGVYGTLATASPGNMPGGRTAMSSWTDSDGHFWMFGGLGFNDTGYSNLNDLWEFDPSIKQWTWMGGNTGYQSNAGVYGSLSVPSAANWPGARQGEASWTASNGEFWLFGGNAVDANGVLGLPNDLWKYSPRVASTPGSDFTLSLSQASMLVMSGNSGIQTVTISPEAGFNSTISFACSGLPADATCTFSPMTVTPSAAASSTTLTVSVAAPTALLGLRPGPGFAGYGLAMGLCLFGLRRLRRFGTILLLVFGLAGLGAMAGCGNASHIGDLSPIGQPAISVVTVTATAGTLQHATNFWLTVN